MLALVTMSDVTKNEVPMSKTRPLVVLANADLAFQIHWLLLCSQ